MEHQDQYYKVLVAATNSGAVAYKSPSFDLMGISASFGVDYDPAAGAAGNDHDAVATKDSYSRFRTWFQLLNYLMTLV